MIELLGLLVLLMLPLLYESSHSFRYYIKFLLYYGLISSACLILVPAFLFRPFDVRNLQWASMLCKPISPLIGLRWKLRGREHLERDQACIIVANHQSSLDVLGLFEVWHVASKCTGVAKRELFYSGPLGLAAWLAGIIYIDRMSGKKTHDILSAVSHKIKQQNIKVVVFAEGTRRNTGELHPFKKGAFHMAIDEQIPVLPLIFSSNSSFLNDRKKIFNAGHIILTALPPIPTVGMTKDDLPALMELVHQRMSQTFRRTSAEVLQRYKVVRNSPEDINSPMTTIRQQSSDLSTTVKAEK